jgi:hypothetical protein
LFLIDNYQLVVVVGQFERRFKSEFVKKTLQLMRVQISISDVDIYVLGAGANGLRASGTDAALTRGRSLAVLLYEIFGKLGCQRVNQTGIRLYNRHQPI